MINLHTLKEVMQYRERCPFCYYPLLQANVTNHDTHGNVEWVGLWIYNGFRITMEANTNYIRNVEISIDNHQYTNNDYYTNGQHMTFPFKCFCSNKKCERYSHSIMIYILLEEKFMISKFQAFVSEESIFSEQDKSDKSLYKIVNNYSAQKTYLYAMPTFPEPTGVASAHLPDLQTPLIPINYANPEETVQRLKKLVVFS